MISIGELIGWMLLSAAVSCILTFTAALASFQTFNEPMTAAVKKCEETLPRNQTCKITFQAVPNTIDK